MKVEIDNIRKLGDWLKNPAPAVFQGLDLTDYEASLTSTNLIDCVFLGCKITDKTAEYAASQKCLLVPRFPNLPFDAFEPGLYSPADLYDRYDPENPATSYEDCLDRKIYVSFMNPKTKKPVASDVDVIIARRIHDASIAEALDDLLDLSRRSRSVAIMGGHDFPRDQELYKTVATLCLDLTLDGYFIVTGGGPGLMEAANLGAYCAGFSSPNETLNFVLEAIREAPKYDNPNWLSTSYKAWKSIGTPQDFEKSRSVGIPTWFYGHEPSNVFATDIAKYFENSLREEGLLAIALAGVIFAQGNAGTVQEIFQDACQNYYSTYDDIKSPMILFDVEYWSPTPPFPHHAGDRRKPVYQLLERLALEKGFMDRVLITDSADAAKALIKKFSPIAINGA
jgi:predicted Rossmann-fold nucleotide-binding protein